MAQAPAQPPATQTPPTLWQCHVCKEEGPIKYALTKKCTTCSHDFCSLCKKDNDIPTPMGTAPARVRSSPITRGVIRGTHAQDPDIYPTSHVPRLGPAKTNPITNICMHASYPEINKHKLTSRPNRPSPLGWWRCSECRNINNPELTDRRCTSCNHIKCASCTAVRVG